MAALFDTAGPVDAPAIIIEPETAADVEAREALLDRAMGPARRAKSSESLRRGYRPADGLAFVARDRNGAVVGTVRLWHVAAGIDCENRGVPALLLGPLAVDQNLKGAGVGAALMHRAIDAARQAGHAAILLVGNAPYYARFGFSPDKTATLTMPGAFERGRFLALELIAGALDGAVGMLTPTGCTERDARASELA